MKKLAVPFALLIAGAMQGCTAGPQFFGHKDPTSCHEPGSDAWWAEKAALPPGVRQKYKKGKIWPARARTNLPPQQFSHTYYSEHYWPLPYVCQDRESVGVFMDTQTSLGWQEETTLYDRHFDTVDQKLTRSGELHLQYILHVVPPERRAVYIQSTYDGALDGMRTDAVNLAMAKYSQSAGEVMVTLRDCQQIGRPAAEVQAISEMYMSTIPAPRLGSASSGSASGGSSGGSDSGSTP